jgi:hypothetical protein
MEPRAIGLNDPIPGLFARYRLKDSSEGFLEVNNHASVDRKD